MSAGHTPGDDRSNYIAHLKLYLDRDIEQANARLIAAAPALLAALEHALAFMPPNYSPHKANCVCVKCEARTALAQAKGESK